MHIWWPNNDAIRSGWIVLCPPLVSAAAPPAYHFEDTFTSPDNTGLTSHTPDIGTGTWSSTFSDVQIIGGKAQVNTPGGYGVASIDIGISDNYTLTCDIDPAISVPGSLADAGLVLRFVNANNFVAFRWRQHGGSDQPGIELWTRINGSYNRAARTLLSPASLGETYSVAITVSGTTITATVNETSVTATISAHQAGTQIGLWSEVAGDRWDNLRVQT